MIKQFLKKFIRKSEGWSIGIYETGSSLQLKPASRIKNPVLTARDVTDVRAEFVADPFMIQSNGIWYMFFEVLNVADNLGDIALATSTDALNWKYQQVVLDEPFHLSYPYVFEWNHEYYMVPETYQTHEVRLYKAVDFPTKWQFEKTLLKGADYVDSSLIYCNKNWWMFLSTTSNDILRLYYAEDLLGQWREHPKSPIVQGDARSARPAGRITLLNNQPIRFAQDDELFYGRQVRAFKVIELTPDAYREEAMFDGEPVLAASGSGWNAVGMHHIDLHQMSSDKWIACVDAKGKPIILVFNYPIT